MNCYTTDLWHISSKFSYGKDSRQRVTCYVITCGNRQRPTGPMKGLASDDTFGFNLNKEFPQVPSWVGAQNRSCHKYASSHSTTNHDRMTQQIPVLVPPMNPIFPPPPQYNTANAGEGMLVAFFLLFVSFIT